VDQIGGKTQRFPEIDEQDHARIGRVVPGLVLIGVIENDNLTLPPAVNLVFDTNTEPLARLGDDQPKVQPQHTIVWTAMCGQMLAWVEDRKRCGNQPRDVLADAPCFLDTGGCCYRSESHSRSVRSSSTCGRC